MGYIYSKISLNINKKQIIVNEDKYYKTLDRLETIINDTSDISAAEEARIRKSLLEVEFSEYTSKYVSNYSRETRSVKIGDMLEDSFSYLIMEGLTNYDKPYLNIINFAEHLELLLAIAFEISIDEIHEKVLELAYRKGITPECLSLIVTVGDSNGAVNVTVGELCNLHPKIKSFFNLIMSNKLQSNIPMIDSAVQGGSYSDIMEEPNPLNPTAAFRLKLYTSLINPIKKLVTDFYDYKGARKDIVYSQFISGVVFNTIEPIKEYTFYYTGFTQKFYLPHKVLKVR